MNRQFLLLIAIAFSLLVGAGATVANADMPAGSARIPPSTTTPTKFLYVQINATKLRSGPQQFATGLTNLKFGDKLTYLASENGWIKVSLDAEDGSLPKEGFIHDTAVTGQKIILTNGKSALTQIKVNEGDVYLAGKGFNNQVLDEHQKTDLASNIAAVETMRSTVKISDEDLKKFLQKGMLQD